MINRFSLAWIPLFVASCSSRSQQIAEELDIRCHWFVMELDDAARQLERWAAVVTRPDLTPLQQARARTLALTPIGHLASSEGRATASLWINDRYNQCRWFRDDSARFEIDAMFGHLSQRFHETEDPREVAITMDEMARLAAIDPL